MLGTITQVGIGGAIGASARFMVGHWAMRLMGPAFPWGTLAVNVVGSFLMGILATYVAQSDNRGAAFLLTGILGGFTTFSAFSLDTLVLIEREEILLALGYVAVSVLLSLAAISAGLFLARSAL